MWVKILLGKYINRYKQMQRFKGDLVKSYLHILLVHKFYIFKWTKGQYTWERREKEYNFLELANRKKF